jgi:uncharacterized protein involved in oxidation of intracellular sulfur
MRITIMACSGTPEVLWNAFRMGNMMLEKMDDVSIFLNGPAVGYASLASEQYPLGELAKIFTLSEGALLA